MHDDGQGDASDVSCAPETRPFRGLDVSNGLTEPLAKDSP